MSGSRTVRLTVKTEVMHTDDYVIDEAEYMDWLGPHEDTAQSMAEFIESDRDSWDICCAVYESRKDERIEWTEVERVEVEP